MQLIILCSLALEIKGENAYIISTSIDSKQERFICLFCSDCVHQINQKPGENLWIVIVRCQNIDAEMLGHKVDEIFDVNDGSIIYIFISNFYS